MVTYLDLLRWQLGIQVQMLRTNFRINILLHSCCFDNIFLFQKFAFFFYKCSRKGAERSLSPLYLKYLKACVKSFGVSCSLIPLYLNLIADDMDLLRKMMLLTCSMNNVILIY